MTALDETRGWRTLLEHPAGFWFIFWGEFAERCSYYGMRAILLLYLTDRLGFADGEAARVMSLFIAGCYLLPLAGGYLADNYLGRYRTIVGFSLPYILGHVVLGWESRPFLYLALALLAMGSGVIKPNIPTLMGLTYDERRPGRVQLRSDGYALYYAAVNIGAAISSVAMPQLRTAYGYGTAFLFPAGLMAVAFVAFALGKPFYAAERIERRRLSAAELRQRGQLLRRTFGLFLVVAFFWSIFDQSASTWTLFARDHLDLRLGGWQLDPDALQALNPLLILLLLAPVTIGWRLLARAGLPLRATDKMLVGFLLTGLTMALMSAAGFRAETVGRAAIAWQLVAYVLITVAEICISVVGLELAYTIAPREMKGFVTACWLLTVFVGNLLNSLLTPLYGSTVAGWRLGPGPYFAIFALATLPVAAAFLLIARRFHAHASET